MNDLAIIFWFCLDLIYDDELYSTINFSFILIILRVCFSLYPGQTNLQISVILIGRASDKYSHLENCGYLFVFSKYGSMSLIMNDS